MSGPMVPGGGSVEPGPQPDPFQPRPQAPPTVPHMVPHEAATRRYEPPPSRGRTGLFVGLAVGVVALLVLGFVGVRAWTDRTSEPVPPVAQPSTRTAAPAPSVTRTSQAKPTTNAPIPPSSAQTGPPSGPSAPASGPMTANGFGFTAPEGWTRGPKWGEGNEAQLVDAHSNTISVYLWKSQASAELRCQTELKVLKIWEPGQIGPADPIPFGGLSAPGGTLDASGYFYRMHCVKRGDLVYNLSLKTKSAQQDASVAALKAVAATWHWSS